jgi:hypothetical protein
VSGTCGVSAAHAWAPGCSDFGIFFNLILIVSYVGKSLSEDVLCVARLREGARCSLCTALDR